MNLCLDKTKAMLLHWVQIATPLNFSAPLSEYTRFKESLLENN